MNRKSGETSRNSVKQRNRPNRGVGGASNLIRETLVESLHVNKDGLNSYKYLSPSGVRGVKISENPIKFERTMVLDGIDGQFHDRANRFRQYRVLSATLVFTPNRGADQPGRLFVRSFPGTDIWDERLSIANADKVVPIGRSTPVRFPLSVDPSWKFCANETLDYPGKGEDRRLVCVNTAKDIGFSFLQYAITGLDADDKEDVGSLDIEIHAEFRHPKK